MRLAKGQRNISCITQIMTILSIAVRLAKEERKTSIEHSANRAHPANGNALGQGTEEHFVRSAIRDRRDNSIALGHRTEEYLVCSTNRVRTPLSPVLARQ